MYLNIVPESGSISTEGFIKHRQSEGTFLPKHSLTDLGFAIISMAT